MKKESGDREETVVEGARTVKVTKLKTRREFGECLVHPYII